MALNNLKCYRQMPLHFKGLKRRDMELIFVSRQSVRGWLSHKPFWQALPPLGKYQIIQFNDRGTCVVL